MEQFKLNVKGRECLCVADPEIGISIIREEDKEILYCLNIEGALRGGLSKKFVSRMYNRQLKYLKKGDTKYGIRSLYSNCHRTLHIETESCPFFEKEV
jgi:hypothetical protein